MAIIKYKPTTAGRRRSSVRRQAGLAKNQVKKLRQAKPSKAGRNNQGRITVRHRGGGVKRAYRIIDFDRQKFDIPAQVKSVEYDPNRSADIALLVYADGEKSYVISANGLKIGDQVLSSQQKIEVKVGNNMPLKYIPAGQIVNCVEIFPNAGAKLARSAGSNITLMGVESDKAQLKLPSGEIRLVPAICRATIGAVGNAEHVNVRFGKAGRRRHLGRRPTVRGKAMNPVDHPHGGGEGGSPIGMKHPKTPWGKPALGVKTRRKNKASNRLIIRSRKKKKR